MHLQCTKAMITYAKPEIQEKIPTTTCMLGMHISSNEAEKNLLILMHDLSRFTLVFYGFKNSI